MKKRVVPFLAGGFVAGLLPGVSSADIISVPGLVKYYTQEEYDQHYRDGYNVGVGDGKNVCKGNPKDCGITLAATMTNARYGETEPNDDMVSANPLVPDTKYWGQAYGPLDQDWYYITTYQVNEMVTLNFTLPQTPSGQNVSGWDISVRDAAGNVLTEFNTSFMQDDPATAAVNESREIKYPVFLGHRGTYYVVVKPVPIAPGVISYYPYNLAVHIEPSDIETPPTDVNFTDVEVEPNDTAAQANPLTSGKTMYGLLNTRVVGDYTNGWALQSEQDWFWYQSPGDDTVTLSWCQREDCPTESGRQWRVTVTDDKGTVMSTFHAGGAASSAKTVRIGLKNAGVYYMQVQGDVAYAADGSAPGTGGPGSDTHAGSIGLDIYQRCSDWSVPVTTVDPTTGTSSSTTATCLHWDPISQVNDTPYNFTWQGTKLPPITYTR